jgi:hypothetical protein
LIPAQNRFHTLAYGGGCHETVASELFRIGVSDTAVDKEFFIKLAATNGAALYEVGYEGDSNIAKTFFDRQAYTLYLSTNPAPASTREVAASLSQWKIKFCPPCSERWYTIEATLYTTDELTQVHDSIQMKCSANGLFASPFRMPFYEQFRPARPLQGYHGSTLSIPVYESNTNRITLRGYVRHSTDEYSSKCTNEFAPANTTVYATVGYMANPLSLQFIQGFSSCEKTYKISTSAQTAYEFSFSSPHTTTSAVVLTYEPTGSSDSTVAVVAATSTPFSRGFPFTRRLTELPKSEPVKRYIDHIRPPRQTYPGGQHFLKQVDTVWLHPKVGQSTKVTGKIIAVDKANERLTQALATAGAFEVTIAKGDYNSNGMDSAGSYDLSTDSWWTLTDKIQGTSWQTRAGGAYAKTFTTANGAPLVALLRSP